MAKNKKYLMTGCVTISVHTEVTATSASEAERKALELPLCSVHHDTYDEPRDNEGNWTEWRTSGELDGEVNELSAEVCDE